jgi:hypothetical protein
VKEYKDPDGYFYVCTAGDVSECAKLHKWAESGFDPANKPQENQNNLSAMIVFPLEGIHYTDNSYVVYKIDAPFHAVGSGSELAIGAMSAGASAKEALKIASQYDIYTGGKLRTKKIKTF